MTRRIMRRKQRSRRKKVIIISTLCLLFVMAAGYAGFQTNLSITAKGNIKEKSRVIKSWTSTINEDFHTDYYRENIVSATFLDNNEVPSNATESWDISEDNKGGVMAWVVPNNENNTKYDLYIGAKNGVIANENSGYLFLNFTGLKSIEFEENFDTSNAISMEAMFYNCISLISLDLSSFNTSNVINLSALFSMWDYRGTTTALTNIDLSNWDTSNVTNMKDMFAYNPNLETIIGINNLDTSKVTNMHGMFINCGSLSNLDLSSFNTENVTNMCQMFSNCKSLTELNLCSFNTENVTNMRQMFAYTSKITAIYVGPNWSTDNADTSGIFTDSGVSEVTTGQC